MREYSEYKTERALKISKLMKILDTSLDLIEEYSCKSIEISAERFGRDIIIRARDCEDNIPEEVLRGIAKELGLDRIDLNSISDDNLIRISLENLDTYLDRIYKLLVEEIKDLITIYVRKTRELDREYMGILLREGTWIFLEGEERSITIPRVSEEVIAVVHTHPSSSCLASREDLETTLDLFTSGGILSAIASYNCIFIMRLRDVLSEECYREFMRYVNDYEYFLKIVSEIANRNYMEERCVKIQILRI